MKRRNQVPSDEARLINAAGDRPIDHLDDRSLERHLENIYLFKLGLQNSFAIDLRRHTYTRKDSGGGSGQAVLFNYLSEIPPLLEARVKRLSAPGRAAYAKLEDAAVQSFWEIYYRFQPLIHQYAHRFGVEVDDLGNVLGRAILLYEKQRGFKFYSYLHKTLRESIKNLRGQMYAEQFHLPLSAGRLMPQLLWLLDQETLRRQQRLTPAESDRLVLEFLQQHPAQFSAATMRTIAQVARTRVRKVSLDRNPDVNNVKRNGRPVKMPLVSTGDDVVEAQDEYEHTLRQIHDAIDKAGFNQREQAILLERLELAYDEDLYARIESELTAGSLRNRKAQLLVRFIAALHASAAPRFGRFLKAEPQASKPLLKSALEELASEYAVTRATVIQNLLNVMSLSESVYKLTISERGRLEQFLLEPETSTDSGATESGETVSGATVSGALYNKLKAALIDQDRLGFPCLRV